ncbi:hypothetical protein BKP56_07065 [Marinilactibacillus sp. 15R]|uniref:hypothetical protein n=1 Tax=Marinilactibacillus sp. 15R TaxID=1911586 RepID=UPI00090AC194|nr:hypothetical protein [Marinilactibacillus sp. 15R]API89028.1 hypothetical protein BKP56_07065 [Marinilactibacillus sp. 15R]
MTVTIIGPTPTTEHIRELQANGKWRLFNGICYVGDYDTKAEAKKYGRMFGSDRIAKAYFNGLYIEYKSEEYLDYEA